MSGVWNVTKPADTDKVRDYPQQVARPDKVTLQQDLGKEHDVLSAAGTATGLHKTVTMRQAAPTIRLTGTEAGAKDVRIIEFAGILYISRNNGSFDSPFWENVVMVDMVNARVRTTFQVRLDIDPTARLVLPVGTNLFAT
jgi:hypothetical protein